MTVLEDTKVVNGRENSTVTDKENQLNLLRWWKCNEKSTWRNISRVISNHCIMGAIFVPISMMVNYSLKTEKEVSAKNDVQREARLIMEYMTEKMRNKNIDWINEGSMAN